MKNIYSNILKNNKKNLSKAIKYLKINQLVGVPTETVYGLAGNAYSKSSINKIYKLKKRPKINPLIVHYHNYEDADKDVILNKNFFKLYNELCPGPITFILKKKFKSKISNLVTANLNTVAVRFPKHKSIRSILKKINFPLAIPSANQSGGISPVESKDVSEEFGKKLKLIVDGGKCRIGIESTVVDLSDKLRILRPGIISSKKISKIIKAKILMKKKFNKIKSPGSFKKHYSPGIPIRLNQKKPSKKGAFITFGKKYSKSKNVFNLSKKSNLNEAAKNLYSIFRKIKKMKYKKICIIKIPNKDVGIAINNRLKHAAS
tara:strand:+ start:931 stop:1884 length:954 start_codon:yes stop_codon:yes gene_type:complete